MKKPNPGKEFEEALRKQFAVYAVRKIATIEKADPPSAMRCIGPGRYRPVLLDNPFPDFVGTWTRYGGRMLAIEAKSTREARLSCPAATGIKAEQLALLQRWADAGAYTCVLWEYRTEHSADIAIVTLADIAAAKAAGRASIRWQDVVKVPSGLPDECITVDVLAMMFELARRSS